MVFFLLLWLFLALRPLGAAEISREKEDGMDWRWGTGALFVYNYVLWD